MGTQESYLNDYPYSDLSAKQNWFLSTEPALLLHNDVRTTKSLGHCPKEPFPNPHPFKPQWELQQTAGMRSRSKGTQGTALVLCNSFTNILLFLYK